MSTDAPAGDVSSGVPLWTPSPERIESTTLDQYRRERHASCPDSDALWQWTVEEPGRYWREMWDLGGYVGDAGERDELAADEFWAHRFLPDARFNAARHLLEPTCLSTLDLTDEANPGAALEADAIVWQREDGAGRTLSRAELRDEVAAFAAGLRSVGVGPGDRVAAWMPNVPETVVAFLAAAAIGATFTSTSADFGPEGVVDRFGQTEPTVLVAADGYLYGGRRFSCLDRLEDIVERLPSVEHVVVVGHLDLDVGVPERFAAAQAHRWDRWLALAPGPDGGVPPLDYAELPGDHPLYILYSSGTTGRPKCIVHRSLGVMLKHTSEQLLHSDIRPGDRVFYFTTCGWMMWNWLVSVLGAGATIILYEGNPAHPSPNTLFELAEAEGVTLLGVSAKYIDSVMKTGLRPGEAFDLSGLRTICSTGSPLSHEGFSWVYDAISADVHLASISGGTDLCGCLVAGDPTKPVYAGAIQAKTLGLDIAVLDDEGRRLGPGTKGELACMNPFPSMPLEFWGDDDGSRYRAAYFERFDGVMGETVWAHGDFASWTAEGGMVIHGRSDATLNAGGVRVGTAEIYRVVEKQPEVLEAICIGQEWDNDTRIVLFVRLAEGAVLDDALEAKLRTELRNDCSPRHVPAVIRAVPDIPRTRSGKIVELAVTETVHGRPVNNVEALANPEALDYFTLD